MGMVLGLVWKLYNWSADRSEGSAFRLLPREVRRQLEQQWAVPSFSVPGQRQPPLLVQQFRLPAPSPFFAPDTDIRAPKGKQRSARLH